MLDADSGQIPYPVEEIALPADQPLQRRRRLQRQDASSANASVNYSDKAFWSRRADRVLHGFTDPTPW